MPRANYHTALLRPSSDFEEGSIRTIKLPKSEGGKGGVLLLAGRLPGETTTTNSQYLFPMELYSISEVHAWLKANNVKGATVEPGKEAQKALCPKCGSMTEAKDGDPSEYECAKCGTTMTRFKLEVATVDEMEIFRTGKWKGKNYTIADLDSCIANHEKGILKGYLYVSPDGEHDPTDAGARPMLSALAHGWIEKLWRVGDRLKAKLKQVPVQIADMIDAGAIKLKSVEIWPNFPTTDGKKHGAAIEAIMMFGRGLPAVYDLDDAVKVYYTVDRATKDDRHTIELSKYSASDGDSVVPTADDEPRGKAPKTTVPVAATGKQAAKKRSKERTMSEELEKLRQAETAKMQAELALTKLKAEQEITVAKLKADVEAAKAETKAETEKLTAAMREYRKADLVKFVDERIKEFQIQPSSKDAEIDHLLGMSEADATARMEVMKKLAPVHKDAEVPTTEPDFSKLPQNIRDDFKKADAIEKVAEELLKKNPAMSASDALERAKASVQ